MKLWVSYFVISFFVGRSPEADEEAKMGVGPIPDTEGEGEEGAPADCAGSLLEEWVSSTGVGSYCALLLPSVLSV